MWINPGRRTLTLSLTGMPFWFKKSLTRWYDSNKELLFSYWCHKSLSSATLLQMCPISFWSFSLSRRDLMSPICLRDSMASCTDRNPVQKRSRVCRGSPDIMHLRWKLFSEYCWWLTCYIGAELGFWSASTVLKTINKISFVIVIHVVIWCYSNSCLSLSYSGLCF